MALAEVPGVTKLKKSASPFAAGNFAYLVTATTSGGAHTIYTATSSTDDIDLVTIWVWNNSATSEDVTFEVGGVDVTVTVGRKVVPYVVFDRIPIHNSNTIKVYNGTPSAAGTGSVLGVAIRPIRSTAFAV